MPWRIFGLVLLAVLVLSIVLHWPTWVPILVGIALLIVMLGPGRPQRNVERRGPRTQ